MRQPAFVLALLAAARPVAADPADLRVAPTRPPSLTLAGQPVAAPFGPDVAALSVAGHYRFAGAEHWLVRGDGGAVCPARFVVVTRAHAGPPQLTPPFGTCDPRWSARVAGRRLEVTVARDSNAPGAPPRLFLFQDGTIRQTDAQVRAAATVAPARAATTTRPALTGWVADGCGPATRPADVRAANLTAATLLTRFRQDYPAELRTEHAVNRTPLTPPELRRVVTGLACLSTVPGIDRTVSRMARPLFHSRTYGRAAFAQLESVGRGGAAGDPDVSAAALSFAAAMRYEVVALEPL